MESSPLGEACVRSVRQRDAEPKEGYGHHDVTGPLKRHLIIIIAAIITIATIIIIIIIIIISGRRAVSAHVVEAGRKRRLAALELSSGKKNVA